MGSALGAGIQALEALEDLHGIGYLHRLINNSSHFLCLKFSNLQPLQLDSTKNTSVFGI